MSDIEVAILKSIDASLKALVAALKSGVLYRATEPAKIATDADLDGRYGNPAIKAKDPRDWTGPNMMGRTMSQCPPEYLDLVASRLDYFAAQAEKEGKVTSAGTPVAPFNRADAARARGWAARMRSGRHTPTPVEDRDEIEF